MKIYQICYDCAIKKKWEPVPYPVGCWEGECDVCKKLISLEKGGLTAPRDYYNPLDKELLNKKFIIATEYTGDYPAIWQVQRKIYDNAYLCKLIATKELAQNSNNYIWEEVPYIIEDVFNGGLVKDLIKEFDKMKIELLKD